MDVLGYLLSPSLSGLPDVGARHRPTRILVGRWYTYERDEEPLQRISKILLGLEKDATFDALRTKLPFKWDQIEPYDTVNPFGNDRQGLYLALWTFDIENDMLLYVDCHHRSRIPLTLLRERNVTLADMGSLGPPVPLPLEPPTINSEMPFWRPHVEVDDRVRAFTHRVLQDFNHQWRHLLRNSYSSLTLRVLTRAIIRISTLNFEVREETKQRHGQRGSYVWITQLPRWEPFKADIVCVGKVYIVLCQSIEKGLSVARRHVTSQESITTKSSRMTDYAQEQAHYMILSVKHIMLCRVTGPNTLQYTTPEPLFNGSIRPPSDLGLNFLIWATATARNSILTPLVSLPVEVQDIILGYVSAGTVAAAKAGCLLRLGSPFLWKDGPLNVVLEETCTNRTPWSPVESQVWFGEQKSGIVYRGRESLVAILTAVSAVAAHATWQELWVGSSDQAGKCVRLPPSNTPVTSVSSTDIRCNVGGTKGVSGVYDVATGDTLTVEIHQQPGDRSCSNQAIGGNHYGPLMIYMTKVADATTADGSSSWLKVAEDTYAGTIACWGTEILNSNCGKRTFTVPKSLTSGNYLVRVEAIALHAASSSGGEQFYVSSFQISVTGGGSTAPSGVSFPGAYKASDPGILINIYSTLLTYAAPRLAV